MPLVLSASIGEYAITQPLIDGVVQPDGVELICVTRDHERIYRSDRLDECDIGEYNIVKYLRDWSPASQRVAVPVFPHRRFRQDSIFVRTDSGIESPQDLAGKPVGVGGYHPAAVTWIKGILHDVYGVGYSDVDWVDVFGLLGRLPDGQSEPLSPADPNNRYVIDDLLEQGTLTAVASAYVPRAVQQGNTALLRRIFDDYEAEAAAYFQQTRVFPIMHVLTMRRSLYEQHPWLGASLYEAFDAAKAQAYQRLANPRYLPLAYARQYFAREQQDYYHDLWEYGMSEFNRRALATVARYCYDMKLISEPINIDDIFVPCDRNTAGAPPMV